MSPATPLTATDERWLTCRIDAGMFSDERAVTYPADGESQKSVFVTSNQVKGQPGQRGQVRVRVIRQNGHLLAVLPSANQDIVTVREADVTPP
jgi:hypothetical protein